MNTDNALYYCRTPLQALIVQRLVKASRSHSVLIYMPTSTSEKHRYYFDKLEAAEKYFIPFKAHTSDTLGEAFAWWAIPARVRRRRYDALYISSIGSIPFSMFARRNPRADIYSFDDGTFNLSRGVFARWISSEPLLRKLVKRLMAGMLNPSLLSRVKTHYSVFPASLSAHPGAVEEIKLFETGGGRACSGRRIRLLLGTWFDDPALAEKHARIVGWEGWDIFVPHPASGIPSRVSTWLRGQLAVADFSRLIAEDVVFFLMESGYRPVVYGFDSTALLTLANIVTVRNLGLRGGRAPLTDSELKELGVMTFSDRALARRLRSCAT